MKLLLDENLSLQHAQNLRAEGYDAEGVVEAGLGGESDANVLLFAIAHSRVILTLDADFANVLRFPPEHTPGVIRLKVHPPTEANIRETILRALRLLVHTDMTGKLAIVDRDKVRVRG